jgi:hypothetical protein
MRCVRLATLAAFVAIAVLLADPDRGGGEEAPAKSLGVQAAAECAWRQALETALNERTSLKFSNTTLQEAVEWLKTQHKLKLIFDREKLADSGIDLNSATVTIDVRDVSLRSALRLMLGELKLTFVPRDEVLLITPREEAESHTDARIYDVSDLVLGAENGEYEYDPLANLINSVIAPGSWEGSGPSSIDGLHGCLVIDQTNEIHEWIVELLAALRQARKQQTNGQIGEAIAVGPGQTVPPKLAKLLALKTRVRYRDAPLSQVIDDLRQRTGIEFFFDTTVLVDSGKDPATTTVTIDLQDVSVKAALQWVCRQIGLVVYFIDDVVKITTQEDAEGGCLVRIYPVADLAGPNSRTEAEKKLGFRAMEPDALANAISGNINTAKWSDRGGPGAIEAFDDDYPVLVVLQTAEVHESIAEFLASLRTGRASQAEKLGKLADEAAKPQGPVLNVYHLKAAEPKEPAMTPKEVVDTV